LGESILDFLLSTCREIDAEHEQQEKKITQLFEEYDIDPHQQDAWELLARTLAARYVPGFSSSRRQGRPKGQPYDLPLMNMIELARREGWSIPRACRAIADAHAIDKPATTLQARYKVLINRDGRRWRTVLDGWSTDFLQAQVIFFLKRRSGAD